MGSESGPDPDVGWAAGRSHDVEVLVLDADTQYLIDLLDALDRDADGVTVHTSKDVDETIERLESGVVDCLVCTYQSGAGRGYRMLDYLREHSVEIPVVLLPAAETTIIDSRNLALDVTSVFVRDEATREGVLGPHLVNVVEQNRAAVGATRREKVKDVMQKVARDVADADAPTAVDRRVCDRLAETSTFDGGWVATVDPDAGAVDATGVVADDEVPGMDDDGLERSLREAAQRAVRFDQPQVINREGPTYAVVPVTTGTGEDRALGLYSDAKYAFRQEEVDLLSELGRTVARTIEGIVTRQTLQTRVNELELFEELVGQLGVGVVVYDADGSIEQANEAFASLLDRPIEELADDPVWNVLAPRTRSGFDDHWASFERGETDTETATIGEDRRELVTTRVAVDGDPYNVTVVVEPEAAFDPEFADLLSYEFRHWLDIAEQAVSEAEGGELRQLRLLDEIVDRMRDAIESEVSAFAGEGERPGVPGDGIGTATEAEPLLLGEVARTAWNHVLGEAGAHEVRGSHAVYADEGTLLRLFEHLFRTLLHYADGATGIDVGLSGDGFFVEDNGSGVPHAERGYAEGWRSSPSNTADGAGILVANRTAERLGWSLTVVENDDGGTRFAVTGVRWAPVEETAARDG